MSWSARVADTRTGTERSSAEGAASHSLGRKPAVNAAIRILRPANPAKGAAVFWHSLNRKLLLHLQLLRPPPESPPPSPVAVIRSRSSSSGPRLATRGQSAHRATTHRCSLRSDVRCSSRDTLTSQGGRPDGRAGESARATQRTKEVSHAIRQ